MPNTCSSEILLKVANSAHGCTGADLGGMCSLAASQAVKRVVVLENIPQVYCRYSLSTVTISYAFLIIT